MISIKNKSKAATIIIILMLAFTAITVALPATTAQEPFRKKTFPIIEVVPNPVGVGQTALIATGITDFLPEYPDGWNNLTVTVVSPDGTLETLGPFKSDTNGVRGVLYTPDQVGTYTFQTHFPEQTRIWPDTARSPVPGGGLVLYEASNSEILELIVQDEELPLYPGVPLPTEYWSRPIDAQAREWYTIGGSWLNIERNRILPQQAPYNDYAPETAHVLWAKPLVRGAFSPLGGGLAGGATEEHAYESGDAYEGLNLPPVVISGVLYTNRYKAQGGNRVEQEVVAVDLRTGEELWARPLLDPDGVNRRLAFGQIFFWNGFNIHGIVSYLWATAGRTWHAFEPSSGRWLYSMTNVPSGIQLEGPRGEILIYTVNLAQGWMTKWNSERVVTQKRFLDYGGLGSEQGSWLRDDTGITFDGSLGIEWNVTIPEGLPGAVHIVLKDRVLGTNFVNSGASPAPEILAMWSISTAPGTEGHLLFNTTWPNPFTYPGPSMGIGFYDAAIGRSSLGSASLEDGVFKVDVAETRQHYGFDIDTGEYLWGPTESQHIFDKFYHAAGDFIYNGRFYSSSMGGIVYCYNVTTGELLWTYKNEDPYVLSEHWQRELGSNYWSSKILFVADGKIYISDNEHSPNDPRSRGAPFICLNATTGEEIFRVNGMFKGTFWGGRAVIGDNIIATLDTYDSRVYAIGKGPSATTVTAPDLGVALGSSLVIRGTVMDISAGTKQPEIVARFPSGVPAVADEDMSDWMLYVYKQFPRPDDAVGVQVHLEAFDPNGNYQDIGTVTTDANGNYGFAYEPPVPGTYWISATFEGSEAYYGSQSTTYIHVDEAPSPGGPIEPEPSPLPSPSPSPSPSASPSPSESPSPSPSPAAPLITAEVAIIAVVVVAAGIGLVSYWFLRKRG